jgi:PAS domain S-box-containing protein
MNDFSLINSDTETKDIIFKSIFDNAQVGIVVTDANGYITHINQEFTRIFGFTPEDSIGKKIDSLFIPDEVFEKHQEMVKLLKTGDRVEYETIRLRKDGIRIPVLARISIIINKGKRVGGFAIYSDISESKRYQEELLKSKDELEERVKERTSALEAANMELKKQIQDREKIEQALKESELRYRTAMDNSYDGIAIMKDGHLMYANKRYLDIYGYESIEEIEQVGVYNIIHPDDAQKVIERSQARVRGELDGQSYEHRCIKKDGSVIHVEVSVARLLYENKPAGIAFVRDITDRKQAELELKNQRGGGKGQQGKE